MDFLKKVEERTIKVFLEENSFLNNKLIKFKNLVPITFFQNGEAITILSSGLGDSIIFLKHFKFLLDYFDESIFNLYIEKRYHLLIYIMFQEYMNRINLFTEFNLTKVYRDDYYTTPEGIYPNLDLSDEYYNFLHEDFNQRLKKLSNTFKINFNKIEILLKWLNENYRKIAGISLFSNNPKRKEVNLSLEDLEEFISSHPETIFVIIQYEFYKNENEFDLFQKFLKKYRNIVILDGIYNVNLDFHYAPSLFEYFDYFISIDNTSLFLFMLSNKPVYYFLKKDLHESFFSYHFSPFFFNEKGIYEFFPKVKRFLVNENEDYKIKLKTMFNEINKNHYKG